MNADTPRPPKRPIWQPLLYWFCVYATLTAATIFYRLRRFNHRKVPQRGPCVIVSNHVSHLDPPIVGAAVTHRQVSFVARDGLFTNRWFGWLIRNLNAIPIQEGARAEVATIKKFVERLKMGECVIVFPEGTRSLDGEIGEFKAGAALLIRRANCPVVPAAIEGAFQAFPRGRSFPKLLGQRVAVAYGDPIDPDQLLADGPEAAMQRLRSEVQTLNKQLKKRLNPA